MSGAVPVLPRFVFTYSGEPVDSGTVTTYLAGTTTLVATYSDSGLSSANQTTITLDAQGACTVYLQSSKSYKFLVKNSAGTELYTIDNIRGAPGPEDTYVDVTDYGALGDGTTDDYAAFVAALATGSDVFVPETSTYFKITDELAPNSNQRIFGAGPASQIRQITTGKNVIAVTGKTGVAIENLKVYATGIFSSQSLDAGILLSGCSRCRVEGVTVENHRAGGVVVYSSSDNRIWGNWFINSPASGAADDTLAFADIAVLRNSQRNSVEGNHCVSGQGTGILVQSVANGENCDDNEVIGNIVKDTGSYGIVAYRNAQILADTTQQSVKRTRIIGNTINGVSGSVRNSVTVTYTYGAGIYLQGAEDSIVDGNTIRNTHNGGQTYAETLAPGGIGVTNLMRCVITNNNIDTCAMHGIDIGEANDFGVAVGFSIVRGNTISNTTLSGISIRQRGRLMVDGNGVDTTGRSGIRVNNTSAETHISITSNSVRNTTGTANIEVAYADGVHVTGNNLDTSNTHGITVANSAGGTVTANTVKNHATRGIQIASTSSNVLVDANKVIGTGTSTEGIRLDAATTLGFNEITGCTGQYAGTYAPWRVLTDNSTAPSVTNGREFLCSNTLATTITNFQSNFEGQEILVVFTNGNTTLDFTSSNLKGNAGVDRLMGTNDAIKAVYRSGVGWYVTVIAAA